MVVVDYSTDHDICYDDASFEEQRLMDENISNFCPRLRQAVNRLSRHRVGELVNHCFKYNMYIFFMFNNI